MDGRTSNRKQDLVIAMAISLPLIALIAAIGIFVPALGLRLELAHRAQRRNTLLLVRQARVIEDQQATIDAYRVLVSTDSSFSLSDR